MQTHTQKERKKENSTANKFQMLKKNSITNTKMGGLASGLKSSPPLLLLVVWLLSRQNGSSLFKSRGLNFYRKQKKFF